MRLYPCRLASFLSSSKVIVSPLFKLRALKYKIAALQIRAFSHFRFPPRHRLKSSRPLAPYSLQVVRHRVFAVPAERIFRVMRCLFARVFLWNRGQYPFRRPPGIYSRTNPRRIQTCNLRPLFDGVRFPAVLQNTFFPPWLVDGHPCPVAAFYGTCWNFKDFRPFPDGVRLTSICYFDRFRHNFLPPAGGGRVADCSNPHAGRSYHGICTCTPFPFVGHVYAGR